MIVHFIPCCPIVYHNSCYINAIQHVRAVFTDSLVPLRTVLYHGHVGLSLQIVEQLLHCPPKSVGCGPRVVALPLLSLQNAVRGTLDHGVVEPAFRAEVVEDELFVHAGPPGDSLYARSGVAEASELFSGGGGNCGLGVSRWLGIHVTSPARDISPREVGYRSTQRAE